ncbi:MAG: restriction endonuclease subunit S [Verrucomicrobiota bacterium]
MKKEKIKSVPELRFPGFAGEWKNEQIGSIAKTITSGSRDWAQHYAETGSKFIRMTNLPRDGIQLLMDDVRFVELPKDSSEGKRTSLEAHDILISITAELGKIGWIPPDFGIAYINQHTALVRLDLTMADARFVAHLLSSERMNNEINSLNDSGAKAGLNLPTIRSLPLNLPTPLEQQRIAEFLTAVDGRLAQLSRKKALLEDYKKGVMQQLFTQALRFKNDHGKDFPDWEEKTLGELTKWASGGTPSKDNASFWEGDIPWMSAATMHERYYSDSPLSITQEGVKSGSKMARKGTLLLLVRGSMLWNRIPVGITTRDVAFNQDVKSISPTSEVSAEFLLHWFIASENMLLHKVVGTGIGAGKLDTDEMKNLPLQLPSPDEQIKIANFLSALDDKIESVTAQITHTQTWKKGLLQQMFV